MLAYIYIYIYTHTHSTYIYTHTHDLYVNICIFWFVSFKLLFFKKYLFGCTRSQLQHVGSSVWCLSCGTQDLVPWAGIEPRALHWELGVLATGPPGKSQRVKFKLYTFMIFSKYDWPTALCWFQLHGMVMVFLHITKWSPFLWVCE